MRYKPAVTSLQFGCVALLALAACERKPRSIETGARAANPPTTAGAMAPNVTPTEMGAIATWIEPVDKSPKAHRVRFATYASGRWSAPTTIAQSDAIVANWADVPSVSQQTDGTLVAHWAEKSASDPYAYDVALARSTDRGQAWQPLAHPHRDGTPTEHGFVSLIGEQDHTTAIWLDGRETVGGGATTLRAATIGEGIGAEVLVDDRVCDCCSTAAALTDDGPVVVYRDRTEDEVRDPWIARFTGSTWTTHAIHDDGWKISGCPVNGPAIDAHGRRVAVAWFTYAGQVARVRVAFSDDAGASFTAPIEVDAPRGTRAPVGRVDVVLDGADAIISWLASDREAGQVLARRVSRDGRLGMELEIARVNAGRDSGFPKLVRASRTELLVMWTETGDPSQVRAVRLATISVPSLGVSKPTAPSEVAALAVGASAPDYSAETIAGGQVRLQELRGKPVLLNVWATWCEPCRHELPVLQGFHTRFGSRGLRVIAANVDRETSRDDVRAFVTRRELSMDVWIDREDRASHTFGIATLPATFLFDATGTLVWRRDGAITGNDRDLEAAIESVLSGERPHQ